MLDYSYSNQADTGNFTLLDFFDYSNTTSKKLLEFKMYNIYDTATDERIFFGGLAVFDKTNAISSIQISQDTGNFSGGTYILYGEK